MPRFIFGGLDNISRKKMTAEVMNRIDVNDVAHCCGCSACSNACPHFAISMQEDVRGFIVPQIEEGKCVDCGLCSLVCDFKKKHEKETNIRKAFSLIVKDKSILRNSTSGGAFTVISDVVLSQGGMVVGAVQEKNFTIHHTITDNTEIRDRMRGSKYVQSDISEVFPTIRDFLKEGKSVLFCGTPCQCAAIKSYMKIDYDNLIVVDFLCHGVPNNRMFKEHIQYLEEHYGGKIEDYTFRDKRFGWNSYNNNIYINNSWKSRWINQIYYNFFVSNVSLRESCHHCVYRSYHRPSDLTIADFWGIEKISGKKTRTGVSLLLSNSEKGEKMIKDFKGAEINEVPVDKILYRVATRPSSSRIDEEVFWNIYMQAGYHGLVDRYFNNSLKKRLRFEIRKFVKKFF